MFLDKEKRMLCRQQTSTKEMQGKGQSHWDPTHSKARGGAEAASERASPDEIGDRSKGAQGERREGIVPASGRRQPSELVSGFEVQGARSDL